MPTPETLAPDRAERLLAGDVPETSREALVAGLVRELRSGAPEPPERLRARVGELRAPASRPRRRRLRAVLVVALLAVAGIAAAALVLPREDAGPPAAADEAREPAGGAELRTLSPPAPRGEASRAPGDSPAKAPAFRAFTGPPGAGEDRARDVDLELELRVRDADAISEAANRTLRAVRAVGGHVASSDVDTEGREGSARLALRVPTRRLEDAVVAISALGTVTAQRVATEDLQRAVDRRTGRIEALERQIRRDEIRLASDALSAEERLIVELRLEARRGLLRRAERAQARLLRAAALAELTVTLHTREAPEGAAAPQGRIERAASDGLAVLARAASVAVFLLVVLGPPLALGLLAWTVRRRRVRRADDALLDRPGPAAS